jgi:hypothetical protein
MGSNIPARVGAVLHSEPFPIPGNGTQTATGVKPNSTGKIATGTAVSGPAAVTAAAVEVPAPPGVVTGTAVEDPAATGK